ncbi:MAG: class I tRNA ligase family protein [Candidatus Pacebacteria bacterium]|nr:class I tRNA ligase family protein [Candidatus Paceibacterota bacterium]
MDTKPPHMPHFLEGEIKLPELEEKILAFWDEHKIFEKSLERTADGTPFTFYDGPPFATGLPHYGHLLASTIKDVVPRYQTMNGRFVRRRWGWDCHGLPIEEVVERKLGISGKKQIEEIGIKTFNETCRSMVLTYVSEWRQMIRRIARWVDFDDSYKTMDTDFMESVWWGFKQMYDKNLIYEGRKVLLYCPRCETPLSNFEVAMDNSYKDVQEESVFVKFHLKPGQKIGANGTTTDADYLMAWTTTPWTLPGNVALAVGKDIIYTALRIKGSNELYIVASELVQKVFKDEEIEMLWGDVKGSGLVGLSYEPLFNIPEVAQSDKAFKVYAADFVNTEDGTGIVHTAVVYGEDDYAMGVREGLPIVPLLDEKGTFNEKAPELVRGMYFKDSERFIKKDLEARGLLFKRQQFIHSYPFCWRCGTALFYNAIPAWFVNIQKIKPGLLKSNDKEVNWFPEHLKHGRYQKSVEAAPDWNISRNRYWGNPVPVWKCADCGMIEAVGSLEELSKKAGGAKNDYWVMRHGEAESNFFDIIDSGQRKYLHLTPRGKDQVLASAEKFKKELAKEHKKIDLIITSDVTRTKDTEHIVASVLTGEKELVDARLEEIHLGPSLTGLRDEKYHQVYPTLRERFEVRPEGGESLRDVRTRLWGFMKECEEKYEGKNILLVTHDYPSWMLAQIAEGWSERAAIKEKEKRGDDFTNFAEVRKLGFKNVPRNDSGEADLHRPYIDDVTFPCKCGGVMRRTPEIFDSWIEAGSMPFAEYHYPFENEKEFKKHFPAQFVAEYIAQTRAWFYLSHVVSFILFGHAPFENVVTTGTILAEDGSKMSKSKNNFPDPKLMIDKYGADSLRFYLMNSVVMQADNLNFSEKGVEGAYRKVGLLLTNVYKYFATYRGEVEAEGSGADAGAEDAVTGKDLLDQWITVRTEELVDIVTRALDTYDTVHATRAIQEYVDDLSTWYLRRSRKRKDAGFFDTMRNSLLTVSRVLAPFMPFLAEALHGELAGANAPASVHLEEWPKAKFSLKEKERAKVTEDMAAVRRLASAGLAARATAGLKVRQPLASMTVSVELGGELNAILAEEVNVKMIIVDAAQTEPLLDTAITGELREEGTVRELTRMFQGLRQKAALKPGDKIVAMAELSAGARQTIERNEKAFLAEIGAAEIEYARSEKFAAEESGKLNGEEVWAALRKI